VRGNSERKQYEDSIELGKQNVECINGITSWCKHARVEMTHAGLYAQMTGLPIGMVEVTCPHAADGCGSMNLPLFLPMFILKNCVGCKSHSPNGSTSWVESIIESAEKEKNARNMRECERATRLAELRKRLQAIPRNARTSASIQEASILELTEGLFDQDSDRRTQSQKRLTEAARVGADLFPSLVLDLLIEQALSEEFGPACLAVCAELAVTRSDLSKRLADASCGAIKRGISIEAGAKVLTAVVDKLDMPMDVQVIQHLVSSQSYYRPIGGWEGNADPEYPFSVQMLSRYYTANSSSVLDAIKGRLASNDKHVRIDVCGVIRAIRKLHPGISIELLPELIESLQLDDDMYEDSADGAACREIAAAFDSDPKQADLLLSKKIHDSSGELQTLLVTPYDDILRSHLRSWKRSERKSGPPASEQEKFAFARCWDLSQDEHLDLKTRIKAAEAMKLSCKYLSDAALPYFDAMLGYLALLRSQSQPPKPPPSIIIPGKAPEIAEMRRLDEWTRNNDWSHLKSLLSGALEELAEEEPSQVIDSILKCFDGLDTKSHEEFKAAIMGILGKLGQDYTSQPKLLPALMKGLMDFDSALIRMEALKASEEAFRYADAVPSNLLDIVVLHLQDQYVAVHKSAVRTIRWLARHLNLSQSAQALRILANHVRVYSDKPFDLEEITSAALAVSRKDPVLFKFALNLVKSVFPTGQQLVDEKLTELLCRNIDPEEANAEFVAKIIALALAEPARDRYNSYEYQHRARFFQWLGGMTPAVYFAVKQALLESASKLAEHDSWEACHFASLLSQFGDYKAEAEVLEKIEKPLKSEKRTEPLQRALQSFRQVALANIAKQDGQIDLAASCLSKIEASEK